MFKHIAFILPALAALAAPAHGGLPRQPTLGLEAANRLAGGAIEACRRQGRAIAVAVVDGGGALMVLQRDERVGPHNAEASRRKAFTALSTRQATLALSRNAQSDADVRNLSTLPELLLLGGGVPLLSKGHPVGAIGVAGGGGPLHDHACALAASALLPALDQPQP